MILDERQLGVILQASIDHAKEFLDGQGGFLPFGGRATISGAVEFLEAEGDTGDEAIDALYQRIGNLLAEDARSGEILAATLVANAGLPDGVVPGFDTAVSVLVEAQDYCRSVVAPYRVVDGAVEFGPMIPEEADPIVFAIPAS